MAVDRSSFLLIATALAAGGVGGWALRDGGAAKQPPVAPAPPPLAASAAPPAAPTTVLVVDPKVAGAACDDSVGAAEECPSVGPSDEGICPNIIATRCNVYKATFKPKVAQQAVACLRQLKGGERCDPARIQLCGHAALMAACPEAAPAVSGTLTSATPTAPASVTLIEDPKAGTTPLATACDAILKGCAGVPLAPTLADCRQTLTGMNESGRANMVECMATGCRDRGLIGCELLQKRPATAQR